MTDNFKNIKKVADDITSITIQGATNIAKAALEIMINEIKTKKFKTIAELESFVKQGAKLLMQARPTEPMLFNGMKCSLVQVTSSKVNGLKSGKDSLAKQVNQLQTRILKALKMYLLDLQGEEKLRPKIGAKIIKSGYHIMTHCHSGSVVKVLTTARDQGKKIHVYNTETRPLYQGRRTSADLLKAGVPDTMITDDSAPFFTDNIYESEVHIDIVIIGSDCIKLNGDVYNKIGSFAIAMAAWHSGTPVYIVGSLTKVDTEGKVKIEKRSGKEIRPDAPKGLEIINYAFDMIPAKFITGIITEYGIIPPKDIKKYVKTYYPWMMT
ncbi:MAG: S-methyl-5-thioribose-1-phosphate isomerase [candidate division SR1 bacterium]|nr:S-methyl-5-thioribose-1-phosphate isomerase [candidate division SR1 bacterium]